MLSDLYSKLTKPNTSYITEYIANHNPINISNLLSIWEEVSPKKKISRKIIETAISNKLNKL